MADHAVLAPSNAHLWSNCPGSLLREKAPPTGRQAQAVTSGIQAHSTLENAIRTGVEPEQAGPKVCFTYLRAIVNESGDSIAEAIARKRLFLEFRLAPIVGESMIFGTADIMLLRENTITIIDYKNGRIPVEAMNNWQLLIYLVGAAQEYNWKFEKYTGTIVQPNSLDGPTVSSMSLSRNELLRFRDEELILAVRRAQQALVTNDLNAVRLKPGDYCKFCPSLAICPAVRAIAKEQALISHFGDTPNTPDDMEDFASILHWKPILVAWLHEVERMAKDELSSGKEIPGFKLVAKSGARIWASDVSFDEMKSFMQEYGISGDKLVTERYKSPIEIQKLLPKEGQEMFSERFMSRRMQSVSIAPEHDRRQAVVPASAVFFKDN